MFRILTIVVVGFLVLTACSSAVVSDDARSGPSVALADLEVLGGDPWQGELNYLNYGSADRSTIPVKLRVTGMNKRSVKYAIQYPGEERYNAKESLSLSAGGTVINGLPIISRETRPDGALVVTTQGRDKDDNRDADIQVIYVIGGDRFEIRKNVRFSADEGFFNRNRYVFQRSP